MKVGANSVIIINNLSNGQDDFFLIEIKREEKRSINIVIDGGNSGKKCYDMFDKLSVEHIDYIVLTHIDNDHIQGLLKILNNNIDKYKDFIIVYNKFTEGMISYKQAEKFENLIGSHEIIVSYKDYQQSRGEIIFLSVEQRKKLQHTNDEIIITFLSPTKDKVKNLYNYYRYYKNKGGLKSDNSEIINRSSIMFLLEYKETSVLMTGDGYISDIMPYINELVGDKTLHSIKKLELIKIPHHGSKSNNLDLEQLLEKIKCDKFIITNGDNGNVKLEIELKRALANKIVYSSAECSKYSDLKVQIQNRIVL